ncbi:MAG: hypothetical protein ACRD2T_08500 [Thermoanaerobaculia bacterium]
MSEEKNRLGRFIAELAMNPRKLQDYKDDPEAAMSAADLSDEEKAVLRKGDFRVICDYLGDVGPRPIQMGG